jgi:hypothetical protein
MLFSELPRIDATTGVEEIVADGVSRTVYSWGWSFSGTKDALVSAGIVQLGHFPGDAGQLKTVAHVVRDGRKCAIHQKGKYRFDVSVSPSPAEELVARERRQAARSPNAEVDHRLQPLVDKLRNRYPAIRIVRASLQKQDNGQFQQSIQFQAPLETLQAAGLIEPVMMPDSKRLGRETTSLGDGFYLCDGLDDQSRAGCWDLSIWTASVPREPVGLGTRRAQTEFKRMMRGILQADHGSLDS